MNRPHPVVDSPPSATVTAVAVRAFPVRDYDLATTLSCGQAFRWRREADPGAWTGVVGAHWIRLVSKPDSIEAHAVDAMSDWAWLENYLQIGVEFERVMRSFPDDEPMRAAVNACRGLRLLRQDPWECLASFILSSTKQIVQIRQIIALLCERYGDSVSVPPGVAPTRTFPTAQRLAELPEAALRECKMGFRAAYLRDTARCVAQGGCDLGELDVIPTEQAREKLTDLPGVGRKIADCVLLFAYGRQEAFPIDVWMMRALGALYFPRRRVGVDRLRRFAASHFGPHAGFAQQYLFHHARTTAGKRAHPLTG